MTQHIATSMNVGTLCQPIDCHEYCWFLWNWTTVGGRSWTIPDLAKELKVSAAQVHMVCEKTLLDADGESGTYAMAFLVWNPTLRATVCDREPALEVAKESLARTKRGIDSLTTARFLERS